MFSRRFLLGASPLVAAGLLAACTTSTDANGNTVVTINVATIDSYGRVGVSAVATVLSIAAVSSALGAPTVAIINTASAALSGVLSAFDQATSGKVSFTLDDSSALSAAKSVISAMSTLLADLRSAEDALAPHIGTNDMANVRTAVNALETALALATALLGLVSAGPAAPRVLMDRAAMFRAVGLAVPDQA